MGVGGGGVSRRVAQPGVSPVAVRGLRFWIDGAWHADAQLNFSSRTGKTFATMRNTSVLGCINTLGGDMTNNITWAGNTEPLHDHEAFASTADVFEPNRTSSGTVGTSNHTVD